MKIKVCMWKSCKSKFAEYIIDRLKNDKIRFNLDKIEIEEVPCQWRCEDGPIVRIDKNMITKSNPIKASEMLFKRLNWVKINDQEKKKRERNFEEEDNVNINEVIF